MLSPFRTIASGAESPADWTTPGGENSGRKKENTDGCLLLYKVKEGG